MYSVSFPCGLLHDTYRKYYKIIPIYVQEPSNSFRVNNYQIYYFEFVFN